MEFSHIVAFALGALAGGFMGVLLARRSMTANKVVDQIKAEYEERMARLRRNNPE